MANWNKIVITNAGMQLSTSTLAGSKIQYTHVQTTSTNLTTLTHDQLVALTKFDTVVQDLNTGTVSVADDHIVTIPVQVNNQDVTADYNLYGMAIFAKPTDGQEILYGVAIATVPDLIPAKGGTTVTSTDFNLKVHVGDSSNVEITVEQQMGVNADYVTGALKPYVLTTDLAVTLSKYALKTNLPDFTAFEKTADLNTKLEGYATNTYVDQQITEIPKPDMSKYNTAAEADAKYAKTVEVNQQLDNKVNAADMRKPASSVAGIEEVNAKQDKIGYTPADDAKVVHLSGANNFDTVPTVKNNPLLLASSLPSDLARTSQDTNFAGKLQKNGQDVAIDSQVVHRNPDTGAVSDSVNFTAGLQSGGVSVATSDDIKSIEASAWRELDLSGTSGIYQGKILIKIDQANRYIYFIMNAQISPTDILGGSKIIDLSSVVTGLSSAHGYLQSWTGHLEDPGNIVGSTIVTNGSSIELGTGYGATAVSRMATEADPGKQYCYVVYDGLKD